MVLPDPLGVTKADEEAKFLLTPTAGEFKKGFADFQLIVFVSGFPNFAKISAYVFLFIIKLEMLG